MKCVAILLAHNEAMHLQRCIGSVREAVSEVWVVDSFSTDSTLAIARDCGAHVLQRPSVNYTTQFNWALAQTAAAVPGV